MYLQIGFIERVAGLVCSIESAFGRNPKSLAIFLNIKNIV